MKKIIILFVLLISTVYSNDDNYTLGFGYQYRNYTNGLVSNGLEITVKSELDRYQLDLYTGTSFGVIEKIWDIDVIDVGIVAGAACDRFSLFGEFIMLFYSDDDTTTCNIGTGIGGKLYIDINEIIAIGLSAKTGAMFLDNETTPYVSCVLSLELK